jgi:hypothetical protein
MIPRRLYEHVNNHNWFAVAIDFVIVIVGVFIGIQVSNWNTERHEKKAAQTYIERIREDIAASAQSLREVVEYYQTVKVHALDALDGFEKPVDQLDVQFLIHAYDASRIINRTVERSTFDEMLSAGAMNSIRNIEVRRRLAIYYKNVEVAERLMEGIPPYRSNLRQHMPYTVQAAIFERCENKRVVDARGTVRVSMLANCNPGLPSETVAAAISAIRIPALKLELVHRLSDLDYKLMLSERLIERGQVLDQFLAEAEI